MQRLEVSGAVRPIYGSLGVKRLIIPPEAHRKHNTVFRFRPTSDILQEHENQQHYTTCGEQRNATTTRNGLQT